jgi:hypothetical protein
VASDGSFRDLAEMVMAARRIVYVLASIAM